MSKSRVIKLGINGGSHWVSVKLVARGVYRVTDSSLHAGRNRRYENVALGMGEWDAEVTDLDAGNSDEADCFGMSNHLRWNEVDLTVEEFRAPSLSRLREALSHIVFSSWDPDDI